MDHIGAKPEARGALDPVRKFFSAVLNGAPPGEDVGKYTFQATSAIGLYICAMLVFVSIALALRLRRSPTTPPERRRLLLWLSYAFAGSSSLAGAYILVHLLAA